MAVDFEKDASGEIKKNRERGETEACLHEDGMTCQTRIGRVVVPAYMFLTCDQRSRSKHAYRRKIFTR